MIAKRMLSIFLAVLMIGMTLTAFPITANAVDIDTAATAVDQTFTIETADDLSAAVSTINDATTESNYVISLQADLNNCGIEIDNTKAKVTVTIIGNGHTLFTTNDTVVCVRNGTVNLGDGVSTLTLQGDNTLHVGTPDDDPGLVYILPHSTCNMRDNVTLKNRRASNYLGGGVTVEGGTFIMDGGTIDNCGIDGGSVCYGGGVAVYAGGMFIMDGGTISNCYATTDYIEDDERYANCYAGMGGGVFITDGSSFTMNGGTITDNTATNFGGGVAMTLSDLEIKIDPATGQEMIDPESGKGIIDLGNPKSRAAINGGTISNNTSKNGAGVFASGLIFAFAHTLATDPLDTGDQFEPGLFINGGESKAVEISSNKATDMGGGVLTLGLKNTNKAQIYNAEITNNTAAKGAGVMNYSYWTQLDVDGCTISNNTATSNGGGVMATGDSDGGYTAIKDTEITDNTSGARGAGVYYDVESEIRISGSDVIQNNKFNGKLNNLNIFSLKKPVKVVGDLTGSQIGLSDPTLWDDDKEDYDAEAVSTLRLTDGYKSKNASLNPADVFTSDHESWIVDFGDEYVSPQTTYRYTAKRYDNTLGLPEGYDVNTRDNGEIFIKVPATTFSTYTENVGYLYDEIVSIFSNNPSRFESKGKLYLYRRYEDDDYYYNNGFPGQIYYDKSNNIYIGVLRNRNSCVYVYSANDLEDVHQYNEDYRINMFASGKVQEFLNDKEPGILALRVDHYYDEIINEGLFSDTYSEVELEYDEPLDFEGAETKTIIKIDEYGYETTKYVIDSNSKEEVGSYDYTNEVRLVHRTKVDYHINNADIIDASYDDDDPETDDDIFTTYVKEATGKDVKVGEKIDEFYTVPEVVPTDTNSCPYIFKGWYYDQNNENDTRPVDFGNDIYSKDIYAHWIKVDNVTKDENDNNILPEEETEYGGFDLAGLQIRRSMFDNNFGTTTPGGMRFVTSLSTKVVKEINKIKSDNIEYGYVAATHEGWIDYHAKGVNEKLQYVSTTANGIDTSSAKAKNEDYYGFAHNVNCTSRRSNQNGVVALDHQNYGDYLLYSFVVTYEDEGEAGYDTKVLVRPYIHYEDANGLDRVAYSEYRGNANTIGGCYISYNEIGQ